MDDFDVGLAKQPRLLGEGCVPKVQRKEMYKHARAA